MLVYDNEGDIVVGRKLRRPWNGPYRVAARITPTNYVLIGEVTGLEARSHVNRMARFDECVVRTRKKSGASSPTRAASYARPSTGAFGAASRSTNYETAAGREANGLMSMTFCRS